MIRPRCKYYDQCREGMPTYFNPEVSEFNPHTKEWLRPICDTCYEYKPEPEAIVKVEPRYIPVEPQAHMTRIKKLEEDVISLRNYLTKKHHPTPPLKKKRFTKYE
jgi:hypothetical protein